MKILLPLLMLSTFAFAEGKPWRLEVQQVSVADPVMPILDAWQTKALGRYRNSGHTQLRFGPWLEITAESPRRLFPGLRFITIHWDEVPIPGATQKSVSHARDLFITLAVNSKQGTAQEFFGYGNYEEFGALLSLHAVTVKSNDDAALVWSAFCDLHQKLWKNQAIEKIDDTTWHLGVITIDRFRYYYRLDLDSERRVLRGKLHADEIREK